MEKIHNLLIVLFLLVLVSCNIRDEGGERHDITATINGETWYFYDVSATSTNEGDTRLSANGYLMGDQGAEPANLEIVFVGVPSLKDAGEGYTADFAPTNTGTSAWATLRMPDQSRVFDTKLEPSTTGTFNIDKIESDKMSGTFTFNAKDQAGNVVTVESAEFTDVEIQ